jgi:hypothetical protein
MGLNILSFKLFKKKVTNTRNKLVSESQWWGGVLRYKIKNDNA